ncbi:hypothetical protein ACFQMA_12630 [Halosimplex aquaticum]|uniref:Uncharacterized protein n=1 Tax=Halosimplex aquaticum TaxID=3026162 RepID=A0ABD5Y4I4_9EURY|nr:hypothetical protein [Halosimplex aquaticum]
MDRIRSALFTFGTNFLVGYVLGRLLRGRDAGVRAGMALGSLGAVASWRLTGRFDADVVEPASEPIEIEIDE